MQTFSPAAINTCLVILQVVGLIGVWVMRVGERTSMAHTLRGLCVFVMLLLGIGTAVSFITMPRISIASGVVLAVMAVLAVVDCRHEARI
ncbi:MAG: hypothetical protein K8U03_08885 [Planctomycetia bacterium]|nr:hypothetical protein [Planctomycetia bacterium]